MYQYFPDITPKVSVIMAVNKNHSFLDDAINSILVQNFINFEFIIIVNGDDFNLFEYLKSKYSFDTRVKLHYSELSGLAFALNLGICKAKGYYIARMDSDDISLPIRLLKQVEFLDNNPDISVLGCKVELIDNNSILIDRMLSFYEKNEDIRRVLPYRNPMVHPALMFRRSVLIELQGYKYGNMSEDHELFLRMARVRNIKFHNINSVLFQYRRHSEQITNTKYMTEHFVEISGFLFTEFLLKKSPLYLLGMFIIHPFVRKFRMKLRKLVHGTID